MANRPQAVKEVKESLARRAQQALPPLTKRSSWYDRLPPSLQAELADLRQIWQAGELVTQHDPVRRWTVAEVLRFVKQQTGVNVSDNQFRPWLLQGSTYEQAR